LKLDSITASRHSHADQSLRKVNIAVVIYAYFRDDEARLIVTDDSVAELEWAHGEFLSGLKSDWSSLHKTSRKTRRCGAVEDIAQKY
jgi:hypothetical protein